VKKEKKVWEKKGKKTESWEASSGRGFHWRGGRGLCRGRNTQRIVFEGFPEGLSKSLGAKEEGSPHKEKRKFVLQGKEGGFVSALYLPYGTERGKIGCRVLRRGPTGSGGGTNPLEKSFCQVLPRDRVFEFGKKNAEEEKKPSKSKKKNQKEDRLKKRGPARFWGEPEGGGEEK